MPENNLFARPTAARSTATASATMLKSASKAGWMASRWLIETYRCRISSRTSASVIRWTPVDYHSSTNSPFTFSEIRGTGRKGTFSV